MSEQRILITGGQGFLGRHLAALVLDRQPTWEVLSVGRSKELDRSFTHWITWQGRRLRSPMKEDLAGALATARHSYLSLDLTDRPAVTQMVARFRPTSVFHLAGALRGEPTDRLLQNVTIMEVLLESLAAAGGRPPHIVYASTGAIYGPRRAGALKVSERSKPNPVDSYAISKLASEHMARVLARRDGLRISFARIFNVLGPGQDERHIAGSLGSQFVAIEKGLQPPTVSVGPLTTTRDFLDVRDVATALYRISQERSSSVYNVASGNETSIRTVYELLEQLTRFPGQVFRQSLPERPDDTPRVVVDTKRLDELGFKPAFSLKHSLQDILDYYRYAVADAVEARRMSRPSGAEGVELSSRRLRVDGSLSFGYPIEVNTGMLQQLPDLIVKRYPSSIFGVLTDAPVHALYGSRFAESLRSRDANVVELRIGVGERAKAFESYIDIVRQMHDAGFDRRSLIICLGGGVAIDVGGFVAATYLRGIRYINVPTTMIAQADAAVGGKVAVNMSWAKNFVGAFHHPGGVFADPLVLRTLQRKHLASGIAEAIKVAVIGDPVLFSALEANPSKVLDGRDPSTLGHIVRRAIALKIDLLESDPYEKDLRRKLNFGHSVGHAVETAFGYRNILHGEAVAFGVAVATAYAREIGTVSRPEADRIVSLIRCYELPPRIPAGVVDRVLDHIDAIRLVRGGRLNFVIPEGIGRVRIIDDPDDETLLAAIAQTTAVLQ